MKLLHELPNSNMPRERLKRFGASALSDYELLAIIIRTGTIKNSVIEVAKKLLNSVEKLSNLNNVTIEELMQIEGIGPAKAVELFAVIELGRRINSVSSEKTKVEDPSDIYNLLRYQMQNETQERLVAIYLNIKSEVIEMKTISVGSINSTIIDPKDIVKWALKLSSSHLVIAHNHPSGDPTPSKEDMEMTKSLARYCRSLDIHLLDHVIIGHDSYYSFGKKKHIQ